MPSLADLGPQAGAHAWLYLPIAVLLGALHGLEPGHSKTMMAAFIVAVRGTVTQAILLGVSAALSHTAVVWVVALGGHYALSGLDARAIEPYFAIASAVFVLAIAAWMLWRADRDAHASRGPAHQPHAHQPHAHQPHGHHHHAPDVRRIDTGHGSLALEIFEDGVPPRWRVRFDGSTWKAADVGIVTRRPDGAQQRFAFAQAGDCLESIDEIPEPHAFAARLVLGHGDHEHAYDLAFAEPEDHIPAQHGVAHDHGHSHDHDHDHGHHDHGHPHDHGHAHATLASAVSSEGMDAHERAHARDIARRFTDRHVTTGQIVAFGLTGGLIPCPAAITVLLLCLQLKRFVLAVALVFCFSIGVAATMVAAGVVAALGVRHVRARWSGFDDLARRAPYASGLLMLAVALYMGISGWLALPST